MPLRFCLLAPHGIGISSLVSGRACLCTDIGMHGRPTNDCSTHVTVAALYARVVGDMVGRFRSQSRQPGNRRVMALIALVCRRGMTCGLTNSDTAVMTARTHRSRSM